MDIWQHIIRPGDVWGRFTLYLKQNGQAAVQREVVRSLRLRVRDVVLDLGGGGRALAQLALYSGAVYGVAATAAAVSAATVRNPHLPGRIPRPAVPGGDVPRHHRVRARVLGRRSVRLPAGDPASAASRRPVRAGVRGWTGKRPPRTGRAYGGRAQRPGRQGRAAVPAAPAFAAQRSCGPALVAACLRPVPPHAAGRVPGGLGPGLLGGTLAVFAGGRESPHRCCRCP